MRKGLVQVYTGNGKGKTTAAIGCAIRSAGRGLKVYIIQFMKTKISGEMKILKNIKNIKIKHFGFKTFICKDSAAKKDKQMAEKALTFSKKIIISGRYDIVILDEVNVAASFGLINEEEIIKLIKTKSCAIELILTGRGASPKILKLADLVTEMKEIKHYYKIGIKARKGIEY